MENLAEAKESAIAVQIPKRFSPAISCDKKSSLITALLENPSRQKLIFEL
jgi:hypothetical protein